MTNIFLKIKILENILGIKKNSLYKIVSINNNIDIYIELIHVYKLSNETLCIQKGVDNKVSIFYGGKNNVLKNIVDNFNKENKYNYPTILKLFGNNYNNANIFNLITSKDYELSLINGYSTSDEKNENILYFNFIEGYFLDRNTDHTSSIEGKQISIIHSELECSICNSDIYKWKSKKEYKPTSFFDYGLNYKTESNKKLGKKDNSKTYYSYINEMDSILGLSEEKISEIIKNIKTKGYNHINLSLNCLPEVIGDNLSHSIKELENNINIPIFFKNQNENSGIKTVEKIFSNKLQTNNKNTKLLTIIGYPKTKSRDELSIFLKKIGIETNFVYPIINLKNVENIKNSNYIYYIRSGRDNIFELLLKNTNIPNGIGEFPYSFEESEDFINKIIENFQIDKINELIIQKRINFFRKKISKLRKDTKEIKLGFIIMPNNINDFINIFRGINLKKFIKNNNFGVKIFIYSNKNNFYKETIKSIFKTNFGENIEILFGDQKKDLENFLKDKEIGLYYSEYFNDKRILQMNKLQFSIDIFEPGLEGNTRTLENIIKLNNIYKKINY